MPAAAAALGLDADSLRAAMRSRGGPRGENAGPRAPGGRAWRGDGGGGGNGNGGGDGSPARFVFVKGPSGYEPRFVQIGASNYDYAEVLGGLEPGEEVVLLSAAELQRDRQERVARFRDRMGGGVPGMRQSTSGGRGGGP
jgi:HlyD family secretion protein